MKFLRFIIASVGGYLFASLLMVSLTIILPFDADVESVLLATMLSFIFWLLFILYAFSNVDIKKILIQLLVVCVMLYAFNMYAIPVKGL